MERGSVGASAVNIPPPPPGFEIIEQPQQGAAPPPPPPGFELVAPPAAPSPTAPVEPEGGAMRSLGIGAQGAGRGLADFAGLPVDLVTLAANAGMGVAEWGADELGQAIMGEDFDVSLPQITNPVGGSDWFANRGSGLAEAVGVDLHDPEELSGGEKLIYNMNRYGTEAMAGGMSLGNRALTSFAPGTARKPGVLTGLFDPYLTGAAGRSVAADTAGGLGMGVGSTAAETMAPDSPLVEGLMMLGGGMTGGLVGAAVSNPGGVKRAIIGGAKDPSISYTPGETKPVSRRTADAAAAAAQGIATDPKKAAQTIGQRTALARQYDDPTATTGMLSDDIGLAGLEKAFRLDQDNFGSRFVENDARLKERAGELTTGLRDPSADQDQALEFARQRPEQLAADRDAAALPLLDQAQQKGATVDAQPVADLIDTIMGEAKRPAVRNSLKQAREMLNRAGTDELDDSVKGLYETRKAINDIIEGRTDNPTGQYAKSELVKVKKALDEEINRVAPEFGAYLDEYKQGSRPLDPFRDSKNVKRLLGEETDLRNVAKATLGGPTYGGEDRIREITQVLSADPEASRAWRAAVADVLVDQVDRTGREGEITFAQTRKVFERNRPALEQVFSPDDMATLDRVRGLIEPLENATRQVVPGSPTADYTRLRGALEGAMYAAGYDALSIGMIMKRVSLGARFIGAERWTTAHKVQKLLERMQFDPELAKHLLERPVSEGTGGDWSKRLQFILAGAEVGRETARDEDEDDELLNAIGAE